MQRETNSTSRSEIGALKELLLLLFQIVKPKCVELSQLSLMPPQLFRPDNPQLIRVLSALSDLLNLHYEINKADGPYILTSTVADYIFFPVSNLLKQPILSDAVATGVLKIISFLWRHVWGLNSEEKLLDQLYPVILHIAGSNSEKGVEMSEKDFQFKEAVVSCMVGLIEYLPPKYFEGSQKRLSLLGSTITILLNIMSTCNATQADFELVNIILCTLKLLYKKHLTTFMLQEVFPGNVSKLVNYLTTSKNIYYTVIVNVMELLKEIIIKAFGDEVIHVEPSSKPQRNLNGLRGLLEDTSIESSDMIYTTSNFEIKMSSDVKRPKSWLTATSKQLKISLIIMFKQLLITSPSNKLKVRTKTQVSKSITDFVKDVLESCFFSLGNEFLPIALDVLSLLLSNFDFKNIREEQICLNDLSWMVLPNYLEGSFTDIKLEILFEGIRVKLEDLINNKLSSIMMSTDEERIGLLISSLMLHFKILEKLSSTLRKSDTILNSFKVCVMKTLREELSNEYFRDVLGKKKKSESVTEFGEMGHKGNQLDNIELPPQIDAKRITSTKRKKSMPISRDAYSSHLLLLGRQWANGEENFSAIVEEHYFDKVFSLTIENKLESLISVLAAMDVSATPEDSLFSAIEDILDDDFSNTDISMTSIRRGISLWIANLYMNSAAIPSKNDGLEMAQYLTLDDAEPSSIRMDHNEELCYLILSKSQDLIDQVSEYLDLPFLLDEKDKLKRLEISYAMAIDSIGLVSSYLPLPLFQSDVLIEYLYPLVESLTYQSNPLLQSHSLKSVQLIAKNHYDGSVERLIIDNQDYLLNCLSLRLSLGNLTPSLSGILLIIMKLSGIKLLLTNQLSDIITRMFVLIDSYHGYGTLLEGFFIVFEELTDQVKKEFLSHKPNLETNSINGSNYTPWGMCKYEQLIKLVNDSSKLLNPFADQDSSKYFTRKEDAPFEKPDGDSDDETDDETDVDLNNDQEPEESPWTSPIPKSIYFIIQRMFSYGFRLLSHPSANLKVQIIKTMKSIYPILCTDYKLLLPLVASNWSILMSLISGTLSVSKFVGPLSHDAENLSIPAVELAIDIINNDTHEKFLSKKFIESWDFLIESSKRSNKERSMPNTQLARVARNDMLSTRNPNLLRMYVKYILTGMRIYERFIPDITAYNMASFCITLGIPKNLPLGRDTNNILWLLRIQS